MTALNAVHPAVSSENWDEDFVFQQQATDKTKPRVSDGREPRWSTSTSDWRSESNSRRSKSSVSKLDDISGYASNLAQTHLQTWAEPGPSSPPRLALPAENWDDDFEDKVDSPARPPHARNPRTPSKRTQLARETENWDDDFEPENKGTTWESSDEEEEEEEDGLGFADQEEDRTVTARSRRAAVARHAQAHGVTPPPPVPPLPTSFTEPFPRSPSMSVFTLPSGRESATYSSLAHVPLRAGSASALAILPPSPPIHRERRRLRKKSRPPDHTVFELLDREPPPSPPPPASPAPAAHDLPPVDPAAATKTPLLSRIGSVKKWGARKTRVSTGPAEVLMDETERDKEATPRASASHVHSPSSSTRASGWFFRNSGGQSPPPPEALELRHERSLGRLRVFSSAQDSPTKPGKKHASVLGSRTGSASTPEGTPPPSPRPRRPTSMQVPPSGKPMFPRQASHGTMTVGRSASRSTFSTSTDDVSRESGAKESSGKEKEGHRSFMGGMRRISLVPGRHKRTKSTVDDEKGETVRASPGSPPNVLPELPSLPSSSTMTLGISEQLLPPIELQPPSPPRESNRHPIASLSDSIPSGIESLLLRPSVDLSSSLPSPSSTTPRSSPKKTPGSPQSASLGRSTNAPPPVTTNVAVPRRNSLGDLKIPTRISQAQVGLKRDLGMVREFASGVERLKDLLSAYHHLVQEAQTYVDISHPPTRATSPTFFSIPRPRSRARSNTNPVPTPANPQKMFASAFYTLNHKYRISWECAELLIELGGGTPASMSPTFSSASAPAPVIPPDSISGRKSRERAVTLAGDESAPLPTSFPGPPLASPPDIGWRASTGRNDLSQRQLWLLRDMLNKPDASPSMLTDMQIPEEDAINRNWRWGDPMSSTVTLPSEESVQNASPSKKRRSNRLGMSGLRDMLRSLTRNHQHRQHPPPFHSSSASASADSSLDSHAHGSREHTSQRRRAKTSTGPDSVSSARAASPFATTSSFTRKSPRRPSLASIFRFSQKSRPSVEGDAVPPLPSNVLHSSSSGSDLGSRFTVDDEEDWDRVESVEDLEAAARALGVTEDGMSKAGRPVTPKKNAAASQSSLSLWGDSPAPMPSQSQVSVATAQPQVAPFTRPTRLSNVEETAEAQADQQDRDSRSTTKGADGKSRLAAPSVSPHRAGSHRSARGGVGRKAPLSGSVRSAPPPSLLPAFPDGMGDPKLALTPETIRPLLENSREVQAKCAECIGALRTLLATRV